MLAEFGSDLVNQPGVLPEKAHGWFRNWFAKVWRVRGGGTYALGYAVTFVYFEIDSITSEVAGAESVAQFMRSELIEFVFRFLSDSMINFVKALAWPVYLIETAPPWGLIVLVASFILVPRFLKKPIESWLFDGDTRP